MLGSFNLGMRSPVGPHKKPRFVKVSYFLYCFDFLQGELKIWGPIKSSFANSCFIPQKINSEALGGKPRGTQQRFRLNSFEFLRSVCYYTNLFKMITSKYILRWE